MLDGEEILRDENGDLHPNSLNPVNPHPPYPGAYPPCEQRRSRLPPLEEREESTTIGRSNHFSVDRAGPFFQLVTTDVDARRWLASVLIIKKRLLDDPKLHFTSENDLRVDQQWEVLDENFFDFCLYRVNLSLPLLDGEKNEPIDWRLEWRDGESSAGRLFVPQLKQRWRGAFFSCNGFDYTVEETIKRNLTYSNVWNHLLGEHEKNPFHLLIWGGDQIYIDFIFEDIPYLRAWVKMDWNYKWTTEFRPDLREQVEFYYFNSYLENWTKRKEIRQALESIPSVMMWDDHDIFDGAGSYPTLLHDSPMMMGLFHSAQKMRLLFQHHTTRQKARDHRLFGHQGFNQLIRCGPSLALITCDGRTERTTKRVHHPETNAMLLQQIETLGPSVDHLIVLFPVPFSFVRVRLAESILHQMKNSSRKFRESDVVKRTNSVFGLPELYDDLLDEWTHANHLDERNLLLRSFQKISQEKRLRLTFFSGDVHCSALSRFRSSEWKNVALEEDHRLMYQVISSAIVNMPPTPFAIRLAHRFPTKWNPVERTEEEILDFFNRKPETNRFVLHQKFRPNRNFVSFEEIPSAASATHLYADQQFCRCFPAHPNSNLDAPLAQPRPATKEDMLDLKIRFWLEPAGMNYQSEDKHFASYDLIIPHLT